MHMHVCAEPGKRHIDNIFLQKYKALFVIGLDLLIKCAFRNKFGNLI